MNWREIREEQFRNILAKLAKAKSPSIKVLLAPAPSGSRSMGNARGIIRAGEDWKPTPGPISEDSGLNQLLARPTPQVLYPNEVFWIGLEAARPGRIFLWNLGLNGSADRLIPNGESTDWIDRGQVLWVNSDRQLVAERDQAISFVESGFNGPAHSFPERLLAITCTRPEVMLTSADLDPDWKPVCRGNAWGTVAEKPSGFWSFAPGEFEWGILEVPVQERAALS